jgi:hypothetical protein
MGICGSAQNEAGDKTNAPTPAQQKIDAEKEKQQNKEIQLKMDKVCAPTIEHLYLYLHLHDQLGTVS